MGRKKKKKSQHIKQTSKASGTIKATVFAHPDYIAAALTAVVFVGHLFTTDDYFLGSGTDLVSHEHPMHVFATSWMARGVLPLWNPFIFGGIPFQAGVHGYLYPGWWTGIVFPAGFDIKLGILLHLVIAALGGVWFARGRVESRIASYAAGITFALSSFSMMHLFAGHRVMVATAAYLPWVAGALDRATRGQRRHALFGIALSGLMLLAGHYQIIFYGMGSLLIFKLVETLVAKPAPTWRARGGNTAKAGAYWLLLLVGGVLIAAVQLAPMFSTVNLSQRAGGSVEFAASFSSAPANLVTFLLPNLYGNKIDIPFVGDWSYWESLCYLGLAPLSLIVLGVFTLPWRRSVPALLMIFAATIVGLGAHTPAFDVYANVIPGADLFRSPGRFSVVAVLFGSLLAATTLDAWLRGDLIKRHIAVRIAGIWIVPIVALVATIAVYSADAGSFEEYIREIGKPRRLARFDTARFVELLEMGRGDAIKALLILTGASVCLTIGWWNRRRTRALGLVVVALLVGDLYDFGHRFLPTGPQERFHLPDGVADLVTENATPALRIIPPAETRWPNFPSMSAIGNPGGYDTFLDGRHARYINRAEGRKLDKFFGIERIRRGSRLIRHLGAEYLLTMEPLRGGRNRSSSGYEWFKPLKRIGKVNLYRDPDPPPRVALVHRVELIAEEQAAYSRMEQASFDIRNMVIIEEELNADFPNPEPLPSGSHEEVAIELYEPNRVELTAKAASQAVLVLSDTLHPGWNARVDGKEVSMIHANRVMRAVPIAPGTHRVVMTYLPASFLVGSVISVAAILALAAAFVIRHRRKKTDSAEQ